MNVLFFVSIVLFSGFLAMLLPAGLISAQMNAELNTMIFAMQGKKFLKFRYGIVFVIAFIMFIVLFPFTFMVSLAMAIDRPRQLTAMVEQMVLGVESTDEEAMKLLDSWKVNFLKRKGIEINGRK